MSALPSVIERNPTAAPDGVSDWVIRVEGVGKMFPIYERPVDRLKQFILPRLMRLSGVGRTEYHREFWALDGVTFTVRRGETVGVIGRNGAGKSTLLQVISGTLDPTVGTAETRGRIAALLELGAGFNPEFTGRENVFLNGAVLGLTAETISDRLADIIQFADIGEFIDQPVKTYSTGMFVRLAFAVQASLNPDILIVDEALSVGDIGFQYKCFRRMESLKRQGVTILMVTHATGAVLEYADRCIVLDRGRIIHDTTDVLAAVLAYEKNLIAEQRTGTATMAAGEATRNWSVSTLQEMVKVDRNSALGEKRFGSARAIIASLSFIYPDGTSMDGEPVLRSGDDMIFRFHLIAAESIENVVLGISVSKTQGGDVWGDNNLNAGQIIDLTPGELTVDYSVRLPLSSGEYLVHCGLACFLADQREELDQRRPMAMLRVWSPRAQVGVVFAPVRVSLPGGGA